MSRRKPRRWHRRIAGVAVAIVFWFALSGILLNHAHDLSLDQRPLPASLAQFFYAPRLPVDLAGQPLGERWFFTLDGTLYRDAKPVGACRDNVRGAVDFGDWQAVACDDSAYVLDRDGNRIEHIDAAWGLSGPIRALAVAGNGNAGSLVIATSAGTYCVGSALDKLQPCSESATPTPPTILPANMRSRIAAALAPPGIDVERFVHDLHSGRLFGAAARWVWDAFALALLVLAGSGLLLLRRRHH